MIGQIACGGNSVVASGSEGVIISSNSGTNWTVVREDLHLDYIIYGDIIEKYLGWKPFNQTVWSSNDEGKTWKKHIVGPFGPNVSFRSAATGEEAWIMVGTNVIISNGDNLDEWSEVLPAQQGSVYPGVASINTPQGSIYVLLQVCFFF